MKKTLALLLAVAFAVPAFAGNVFSNVETYGEIETIGYNTNLDTAMAGQKAVANRVLFGLGMDLVEDVRANITFQYNNVWQSWNGETVDDYLQNIVVQEANVVISNVFGAIETKIGRQFYGGEDNPVLYVGPRHGYYNGVDYSYSLDGALATWSNDNAAVSAFYGQTTHNSEYRLTGLTFDYAFNNNLTAGLYWYDYSYPTEHQGVWGLKAAYQNEEAKLGAYYAKNYDNGVFSHNNEGWMLKVDASMNLDMEKLALTPRLSYYHTEKEYYVDDANYTAGIILANEVGDFSYSGDDWRVFNAGIDFGFKALEKVTFAFDYLNAKVDNEWFGNEFDLVAKYQHNDYVSFNLGGALVTNVPDESDSYAVQVGMAIKF